MRTVPKKGRINLDRLRNKTSATTGSIANLTARQISSLRKPLHSRVNHLRIFAEYANSPPWIAAHIGQFVSYMIHGLDR